jgi:hypothetical protein
MKTSIRLLCLFVIAHLASEFAFAQVPSTISYQGVLTGAEGQLVEDGSYDMHFRLYSGSGSQTAIWEETRSVSVQNGLFSVLLGTINPLDLPFDQPYYLGLAVGEAPELTPRMALSSSAYSFRARSVDDGQVVTSLNGLRDNITLVAGDNIGLTQSDSTIVISALINAGEGTITGITAGEGLTGGGTAGVVTLSVANGGITTSLLGDGAVTNAKLAPEAVTEANIADSSVTGTKIHPDIDITTSGTITAGSFTGDGSGLTGLPSGSLELPFAGTVSVDGAIPAFSVTNSNASGGVAIKAESGNFGMVLSASHVGLQLYTGGSSIMIDRAGGQGTYGGHGVWVRDAYGEGFRVDKAGGYGIYATGNLGAGLFKGLVNVDGFLKISSDTTYAVNSHITSANGYSAYFTGVDGSKNYFQRRVGIGIENPAEKLHVDGAIRIGNTGTSGSGTIRWNGTDFEGRTASQWVSLTSNNAYIRVTPDEDPNRAPTIVAGHPSNSAPADVSSGSIIAGGGLGNNPNSSSSAFYSTISGGAGNRVIGYSYSVIGGGFQNKNIGSYSTIGGGFNNITGNFDDPFQAQGEFATIGGGSDNLARGLASTVPGGAFNSANGSYSLAAGRRAKAVNDGTFIWADATNADFNSTGSNQFLVRAAGGVGINTNSPRSMLTLQGPDDSTFGPNILLFGNASDQFESGRIRFVEGTALGNWRGAYLHFDGSANKFHIGVHNTNDNSTANDVNALTITRTSVPSVGIGTENPSSLLHVFGNVVGTGVLVERDGGALVKTTSNISDGSIGTSNNTAFRILTNNTVRMHVPATGGVGIGTTNPGSFLLAVNGDAAKPGGGSWSVFSDQRLKRDIRQLEPGALNRLLSIHGYTFEYHDEAIENRLALPGRQTGLIAQEVLEVFPDWVGTDEEGYLYVTERGLTAMLIEALRELRQEKDAHIEQLILQNRALEERLEREKSELATRLETEKQALETRLEREKYELATRLENIEAALGIPSPAMKTQN